MRNTTSPALTAEREPLPAYWTPHLIPHTLTQGETAVTLLDKIIELSKVTNFVPLESYDSRAVLSAWQDAIQQADALLKEIRE